MNGTYVPPRVTPITPEHLSRAYRTVLTRLIGAPSDMAVAVLHGHCALETGHTKSCILYNLKNIKHSKSRRGLYTAIKLNERLLRNGERVYVWFDPVLGELLTKDGPPRYPANPWTLPPAEPQCRMRAYESLDGAATDQVEFLMQPEWRPALDLALAGKPAAYVDAIADRGYFTADRDPYRRSVVQLTAKYLPIAVATGRAEAHEPVAEDSDELCSDIAACHRFELPSELAARIRAMQAEHVDFALEQSRKARDEAIKGDD